MYHVVVKTCSVKCRAFGPKCPSLVAKCTIEIILNKSINLFEDLDFYLYEGPLVIDHLVDLF